MESSRKRRIRSGSEFDHLFPPPSEEDVTVKRYADVEDTMRLIQRTVPQTLWQTKKIARMLKGRTLEETCSNIWHFVYNHIQYKRDEDGVEQVRSPRRTWWERKTGVDCDCYTEFICSILLNFGIPHKARITKYPKRSPEVPRWQHVYPIVPKNGSLNTRLTDRDNYIVIDCVKDAFDDEQPFLESKDYDMKLDYLDGFEQEEEVQEEEISDDMFQLMDVEDPDTVDLADIASVYDDEELDGIFKKLKGAVKKVAKKVTKVAKKVGDKVGQGIRFLNRFTNPAAILLRNGFLLAMKINLMNVAGRLRYAYLTDAQAKEKGVNLDTLKKLRSVKDRAETVYWQAGGKKSNLKKAILKGKGNKDKKVPLSGLSGLDEVYADREEYNIIHSDNMEGLGEIASGTAIAAATSAVTAIAAALKQVKGLFNKGGKEEQSFQSESDNAGDASAAPATMSEDEDAMTFDDPAPSPSPPPATYTPPPATSAPMSVQPFAPAAQRMQTARSFAQSSTPQYQETEESAAESETTSSNEVQDSRSAASYAEASQPTLPGSASLSRRAPDAVQKTTESNVAQTTTNEPKPEGLVQKTTTWIKENPGKALLIGSAVAAGGYLVMKAIRGNAKRSGDLQGLDTARRKRHKKKRKKHRAKSKVHKVQKINLL